jgi:hypothetical protein
MPEYRSPLFGIKDCAFLFLNAEGLLFHPEVYCFLCLNIEVLCRIQIGSMHCSESGGPLKSGNSTAIRIFRNF